MCSFWIRHSAVLTTFKYPYRQLQSPALQPLDIIILSDDEDILSTPCPKHASTTKSQSQEAHPKSCPGYQLTFPPGQWANTFYPFALHNLLSLPWYYSTHKEGFFLTSHSCLGLAVADQHCGPCDNLGGNKYLKNIIARYTDSIHDNSPLIFQGIGGLVKVVHRKTLIIDGICLSHLNDARKLVRQEGIIDVHKQMLFALLSQHISCDELCSPLSRDHGTSHMTSKTIRLSHDHENPHDLSCDL